MYRLFSVQPSQSFDTTKKMVGKSTSGYFDFFTRSMLPELLLFIFCAYLFFINVIRFEYPVGYSGLYALFVECIKESHYLPPMQIPYYGPGGIPFAYPPLALYISAAVTDLFDIPVLTYIRFAPPVFGLLFLIAIYFFTRPISGRRIDALLSVIFLISSSTIYDYHVTAAGFVRAPALLFTLLGLYFSWPSFSQSSDRMQPKAIIPAGILFALTIMTHLTYAVFLAVSLLVFGAVFSRNNFRRTSLTLIYILLVGVLASAPWWLTTGIRYGFDIFINLFLSHDNLGLIEVLTQPAVLAAKLLKPFLTWGSTPLIGFTLLGLGIFMFQRKWFLPIWFLAAYLTIGEGERFLVLIGAILAAGGLVEVFSMLKRDFTQSHPVSNVLPYFILLMFGLYAWVPQILNILNKTPALSHDLVSIGDWFQQNTDEDSNYLYLSVDHDTGEWLPYLTHRIPVVGHWGAEWTGNYSYQFSQIAYINACLSDASFTCVEEWIDLCGLSPEYIILPVHSGLRSEVETSSWALKYINETYLVFEK